MLGPPNQGNEVIDRYGDLPGFEWVSGPAGLQLGTGEASVPLTLGPVHFDLGVNAGTQSVNPILSRTLPGPDDGKVSVDATPLDGMDDHLELPVTHVFRMRNREAIDQVRHFLANGYFKRAAGTGASEAAQGDHPLRLSSEQRNPMPQTVLDDPCRFMICRVQAAHDAAAGRLWHTGLDPDGLP